MARLLLPTTSLHGVTINQEVACQWAVRQISPHKVMDTSLNSKFSNHRMRVLSDRWADYPWVMISLLQELGDRRRRIDMHTMI
jgi:hypothetical protein